MVDKSVYKAIKAKFDESVLPPRYVYYRASDWRAPARLRLSVHPRRSDKRLVSSLRSRGLDVRLWTPVAKPEPSTSVWLDILDCLMDVVCWLLSGCRPN